MMGWQSGQLPAAAAGAAAAEVAAAHLIYYLPGSGGGSCGGAPHLLLAHPALASYAPDSMYVCVVFSVHCLGFYYIDCIVQIKRGYGDLV